MASGSSPAETLLCDYLTRRYAGEDVDFEGFCAVHPEAAAELRSLRAHHQQLVDGLAAVGAGRADAPEWNALMASMRSPRTAWERYRVGAEIGRGGMGTVHEAFDRDFDRSLSMKVMRIAPAELAGIGTPSLASQSLRRFLAEARLTGRLDHPGVVPVYDLGIDDQDRVFFTMKRVRGRDLGAILHDLEVGTSDWTQARVLSTLERACEAVAYAHSRGVVHRDLKPANLMVGSFGETYVMDWGLALDQRDASGAAPSGRDDCEARMAIGTPAYMAPEQARGEPLGPSADVYGMGAVLYRVLAGTAPYGQPGSSPLDVVSDVIANRHVPIAIAAPDSPPELVAICARAMARDPSARYADLRDMAADLRAFQEKRVVRAYQTGAWAEAKKWVVRNKMVAAAAAAALLAGSGGMVAVGVVQARAAERLAVENAKVRTAWRQADDRAAEANAVASFLENLVGQGDPSQSEQFDVPLNVVLRRCIGLMKDAFGDRPAVRARLLARLGRVQSSLDQYEPAETLLREALDGWQRASLPEDESWFRARISLAGVIGYTGATVESDQRFADVVGDLRQRPEHKHLLAMALGAWGYRRSREGRPDAAEGLLREAVEIARSVEGLPRDELAVALNRLATFDHDYGRPGAAIPRLEEAIALVEPLGASADYLQTYLWNNLGRSAAAAGDTSRALSATEHAVDLATRVFGPRSLRWVVTATSRAVALRNAGRCDEAVALLERCVEVGQQTLLAEDLQLAGARATLAALLGSRGEFARARALVGEALSAARVATRARPHPYLESILHIAIEIDLRSGMADDAERHIDELATEIERLGVTPVKRARLALDRGQLAAERGDLVFAIEQAQAVVALDADPEATAQAWLQLAHAHNLRGEFGAAADAARRAATAADDGGDATASAMARYLLGWALLAQGRRDEALSELRAAVEGFDRGYPNGHWASPWAYTRLADALSRVDPSSALCYLGRAFELFVAHKGATHPVTLGAQQNYAAFLFRADRVTEAWDLLVALFASCDEGEVAPSIEVAAAHTLAVQVLHRRGEVQQALDHALMALRIREEVRAPIQARFAAHLRAAQLQSELGQWQKAERTLEDALCLPGAATVGDGFMRSLAETMDHVLEHRDG